MLKLTLPARYAEKSIELILNKLVVLLNLDAVKVKTCRQAKDATEKKLTDT